MQVLLLRGLEVKPHKYSKAFLMTSRILCFFGSRQCPQMLRPANAQNSAMRKLA
jgi:hypothetical protein